MNQGMFNRSQQEQLLKGLNASRVEQRKMGGRQMSYLAQHDVRAHLIRLFGFGHFDLLTESADLAYETKRTSKGGGELHDVGYKVTMRLVVRDENQNVICSYSETAVGSALSAEPGEAHDNAVKNGASDAMKRCAINLGDQFGLSLYNNGQTAPYVKGTLVVDASSQTPLEAPVSDEQAEPGQEQAPGTSTRPAPSQAALELQLALYQIVSFPAGDRITEVAKYKTTHKDLLQETVDVDGQAMSLARFADLVAAGRYSQEDEL